MRSFIILLLNISLKIKKKSEFVIDIIKKTQQSTSHVNAIILLNANHIWRLWKIKKNTIILHVKQLK